MGLDMYFQKRAPSEDIGYWRKANAIHNWFVQNVQHGKDDCGEYYVSFEKMQELLDTVNKVIAASTLVKGKVTTSYTLHDGKWIPNLADGMVIHDPSVAQELLPTQSGFFFGSTDYDESYIEDLKHTREILEAALADKDGEYYYSASW